MAGARIQPVILAGGRPPRYSVTYGGIDAFNQRMTAQRSGLSLAEVLQQRDDTHRRLVEFIELPGRPFWVGTQAHPEFRSRPTRAHPLFRGLVEAAVQRQQETRLVEVDPLPSDATGTIPAVPA